MYIKHFLFLIFISYDEAKIIVHKLGFSGEIQWKKFTKSKKFSNNLPKSPSTSYKRKKHKFAWVSWPDFLGN